MSAAEEAVATLEGMNRHLERLRMILKTYDQPIEALR